MLLDRTSPWQVTPNNKATYCQTCEFAAEGTDCKPKQQQLRPLSDDVSPLEEGVLEQPPTPPSGPAAPLQDGGVLQQPPSQGVAPPLTRGQGVLPEDGVLQQPPADEGAEAPRTVEPPSTTDEAIPCPDGLVFDEETDLCVLEEPEVAEEEPEQSEPEEQEQQSSEEGGGAEDSSDSDDN